MFIVKNRYMINGGFIAKTAKETAIQMQFSPWDSYLADMEYLEGMKIGESVRIGESIVTRTED